MLKFNNNHIITGYIKQLLASYNLPTARVYTREFESYKTASTNQTCSEDPRVLSSIVKTSKEYPTHLCYINYIKDGFIQRYYDGQWHQTAYHYHPGKFELNQTRHLKIKDNIYDSYTHEYLGDYLRFMRDYNNVDLMPLYNCFSDRLCPLIQVTFDVPVYQPQYDYFKETEDGKKTIDEAEYLQGRASVDSKLFSKILNTQYSKHTNRTVIMDSTDSTYKIYMVPAKLFQKYTIAIDSPSLEVFCGFYGNYFDTRDSLVGLSKITYNKYTDLHFNTPVLFSGLTTDNIHASEATAAEYAQNERSLKLFLKVPADNSSTITILEGDFTAFNNTVFSQDASWDSTNEYTEMESSSQAVSNIINDFVSLEAGAGRVSIDTSTVSDIIENADDTQTKKTDTTITTTITENHTKLSAEKLLAGDFAISLDADETDLNTVGIARAVNCYPHDNSDSWKPEIGSIFFTEDGTLTISGEGKDFKTSDIDANIKILTVGNDIVTVTRRDDGSLLVAAKRTIVTRGLANNYQDISANKPYEARTFTITAELPEQFTTEYTDDTHDLSIPGAQTTRLNDDDYELIIPADSTRLTEGVFQAGGDGISLDFGQLETKGLTLVLTNDLKLTVDSSISVEHFAFSTDYEYTKSCTITTDYVYDENGAIVWYPTYKENKNSPLREILKNKLGRWVYRDTLEEAKYTEAGISQYINDDMVVWKERTTDVYNRRDYDYYKLDVPAWPQTDDAFGTIYLRKAAGGTLERFTLDGRGNILNDANISVGDYTIEGTRLNVAFNDANKMTLTRGTNNPEWYIAANTDPGVKVTHEECDDETELVLYPSANGEITSDKIQHYCIDRLAKDATKLVYPIPLGLQTTEARATFYNILNEKNISYTISGNTLSITAHNNHWNSNTAVSESTDPADSIIAAYNWRRLALTKSISYLYNTETNRYRTVTFRPENKVSPWAGKIEIADANEYTKKHIYQIKYASGTHTVTYQTFILSGTDYIADGEPISATECTKVDDTLICVFKDSAGKNIEELSKTFKMEFTLMLEDDYSYGHYQSETIAHIPFIPTALKGSTGWLGNLEVQSDDKLKFYYKININSDTLDFSRGYRFTVKERENREVLTFRPHINGTDPIVSISKITTYKYFNDEYSAEETKFVAAASEPAQSSCEYSRFFPADQDSIVTIKYPANTLSGFVVLKNAPNEDLIETSLKAQELNTRATISNAKFIPINLASKEKETTASSKILNEIEIQNLDGDNVTITEFAQFDSTQAALTVTTTYSVRLAVYADIVYSGADPQRLEVRDISDNSLVTLVEVPCGISGQEPDQTAWPVYIDLTTGGTYQITFQSASTTRIGRVFYIEARNNLLFSGSWSRRTNRYITNFEEDGGDDYPEITTRAFTPITTLQLLKYNTGISYPFADRLIEYITGNAVTSLDEIADNVKRAQAVMQNNGYTFDYPGAWEAKMRNILYDYMTRGKATGEQFNIDIDHDILGYVDKDTEKYYTTWVSVPCYNSKGEMILVRDKYGNPITVTEVVRLATNSGLHLKDSMEVTVTDLFSGPEQKQYGRYLVVDRNTTKVLVKAKLTPKSTISNIDIYGEDE